MYLRLMNDPVLREPTISVSQDELDYVKSLVPDMTKIMNDEGGYGLAANQVGISKRFFIKKDGEGVKLIINPEILELGPLQPYQEGCLSIPGTNAETQRAYRIKFKYKDESFNDVEEELTGIDAIAIQHEVDHLDGKLYTDSLSPMKKMLALKKYTSFVKRMGRR